MPTTDGRISKIRLPDGKLYDVGSGGSGTVDSTWVTASTNPVESQLIQNTKPGLINTSTHGEAFGNNVTGNASGSYSHIEGSGTQASGENSHAQNYYTIAASDYQTALGKYNVEDSNDTYAVIIGNGTGDNARSNATTITWDGTIDTTGSLYVRGNDIFMGSDASGGLTYYPNGPSSTITDPAMGVKVMPDIDYENGSAFGLISMVLRGAGNTFLKNADIRAMIRKGTTSVEGQVGIQLGNTTAAGTAGNRSGSVRLYTKGTAETSSGNGIKPYIHIDPPTLSGVHGNYTVTLPSEAGTIALVSDIDTSTQSLSTSLTTLINSTDTTNRTWTTSQISSNDTTNRTWTTNQIDATDTTNRTWTTSQIATAVGKEYGALYNDASDWSNEPWYPIAIASVNTLNTNLILELDIQRTFSGTLNSYGTLFVHARINDSFSTITSFTSSWRRFGKGTDGSDSGILGSNTAVVVSAIKYSDSVEFAVWMKMQSQYDGYAYRMRRGCVRKFNDSDHGHDDIWSINTYKGIAGYTSYPTGSGVVYSIPDCGTEIKDAIGFSYNNTFSYSDQTTGAYARGRVYLYTPDISHGGEPDYTTYNIQLPKKNGTVALVSDLPTVPTDYVPLGGTSSNSPVTGKIEFTGSSSYLVFNTNNTGVRFVDSSSDEFSGVAWNGSNFWLGARSGSQPTHAGKTLISTGWDTTNSVGYNTIAVSIPRSKDGSTTAVTRYLIHTGDNTFNTEDTFDEAKEIKLNNSSYSRDIRFRATNSHSDLWFGTFASSNDGGGIYNITGSGFVMKSSTASGSLVNTFYGNANSATAIKMNEMASTSNVQRYLTQTPNLSGDATNQYASNGLWTESTYGSTSTIGYTHLHLGNTLTSSSAGNNRGFLYLHGPGANYATLQFDGTSNVALSLPTSGGTLALANDVKITSSTVSTSGSGNAITGLSISSGQLVATKGSTFLTSSDVGTAASKSYTTSVTSGSSSLVTSGAVYSAMTGWSTLSISTASSPGIDGCSVQANASLVNPSLHLVFIDVLFAFNQNVSAGTSSKTVTAAISSTYRPDAHVTLPFSNGISVNGNAIMHSGGYIQLNIFTAITASSSSVKNIRVAGMYAYS